MIKYILGFVALMMGYYYLLDANFFKSVQFSIFILLVIGLFEFFSKKLSKQE